MDNPDKMIQDMVESGMLLLEMMRPILETLEGYKRELAGFGYNEEQQAAMAADLHHMITRGVGANSGKQDD